MNEEKRSICLETKAPGVSGAQVARRYAVNANLGFECLRDPLYWPGPRTGSEAAGLRFLPMENVKEASVTRSIPATENHIEMDLAADTGCG